MFPSLFTVEDHGTWTNDNVTIDTKAHVSKGLNNYIVVVVKFLRLLFEKIYSSSPKKF